MRRAIADMAMKPNGLRRTLLPWLSRDTPRPTVAYKNHEVMTFFGGHCVTDLSSNLVSSIFADNSHLSHIRLNDMSSIAPQYVLDERERASRRLIELLPVNQRTAAVWWTCTGSEALSTAIWASTTATGQPGVFYVDRSYHGSGVHNAQFGTDARNLAKRSNHLVTPEIPVLPRPYSQAECAQALSRSDELFEACPNAKTLVVEGSSGSADGTPWPDGYLEALVNLARDKHGVRVILDEIMSGLQRCGRGLYAAAARGTSPGFQLDYICEGKALSNGALPVAVTVVGDATPFDHELWGHGSTFSGYPAGVEATLCTLDRHAQAGDAIDTLENEIVSWSKVAETVPCVESIRGQGLLWTVKLDVDLDRAARFKSKLEHKGGVRIFGQQNRLLLAPSVDSLGTTDALSRLESGLRAL